MFASLRVRMRQQDLSAKFLAGAGAASLPPGRSHCGVLLVAADAVARLKGDHGQAHRYQLILLSKASLRDDGAAVLPDRLGTAAARTLAESLLPRKLMRAIRAKPGMPVWLKDENDHPMSLVILRAGQDAIGVEAGPVEAHPEIATKVQSAVTPKPELSGSNTAPRTGTKRALVIAMGSKERGVTLNAMIEATGWLPHTTRSDRIGLCNRGFAVVRTRDGTEGSPNLRPIMAQSMRKLATLCCRPLPARAGGWLASCLARQLLPIRSRQPGISRNDTSGFCGHWLSSHHASSPRSRTGRHLKT